MITAVLTTFAVLIGTLMILTGLKAVAVAVRSKDHRIGTHSSEVGTILVVVGLLVGGVPLALYLT